MGDLAVVKFFLQNVVVELCNALTEEDINCKFIVNYR